MGSIYKRSANRTAYRPNCLRFHVSGIAFVAKEAMPTWNRDPLNWPMKTHLTPMHIAKRDIKINQLIFTLSVIYAKHSTYSPNNYLSFLIIVLSFPMIVY